MEKNEIVVVGATGNVGRKIVELILQKKLNSKKKLRLFASKKSAGKKVLFLDQEQMIEDLDDATFENAAIALFATDSDLSRVFVPRALEKGAKVVDSSSFYRLDPSVPLIVPPVNQNLISKATSLYAVANCVACPISVVLKPLHERAQIARVIVSTYQSVSGAGKVALNELWDQTQGLYEGRVVESPSFSRQIAFNVIPQVDRILPTGFTHEEFKIIQEVKKILGVDVPVMVTSVRVPVRVGHSVSLSVEFKKKLDLMEAREILGKSPSVRMSNLDYTTAVEVEGLDDVYVGRLRQDLAFENGLGMWLVSDNLRRGAALDAVEICQKILEQIES